MKKFIDIDWAEFWNFEVIYQLEPIKYIFFHALGIDLKYIMRERPFHLLF